MSPVNVRIAQFLKSLHYHFVALL